MYVSYITTNPETPAYGQSFNCFIGVSYDEPNLACGLRKVGDGDNVLPWDICPKRNGMGRQSTENNTASYKCIADASTGVSGPGTYQLIAWRFYSDGATGKTLQSKTITISDHLEIPTITTTIQPTITSVVPTSSPSKIPTGTQTPIPSLTSGSFPSPTLQHTVSSTIANPSPTVSFVGYQPSSTPIIPSVHETPRSGSPYPTAGRYDGGGSSIAINVKPIVKKAGEFGKWVGGSAKQGLDTSINFLNAVWTNFFKETSF